ncbi:MAG: Na+/H+ antiporter NhaA, partial [Thermodesulfobacteriota bacterium]
MVSYLKEFLRLESSGAILLLAGTLLGLICANSPLISIYNSLLDVPVAVQIGQLEIAKPLLLWINDGLMAVFFFLVGLELKREFLEGELSNRSQVVMPLLGAVGGMVVPALVYLYFNYNDSEGIKGWAIPAATDIAFALGILSAFGSRAPLSLKIFLTTLAIFDDIGAIIIIALFYSANISVISLIIAVVIFIALFIINRKGVISLTPYIVLGIILWVA